jgi:hypothetical protein
VVLIDMVFLLNTKGIKAEIKIVKNNIFK